MIRRILEAWALRRRVRSVRRVNATLDHTDPKRVDA